MQNYRHTKNEIEDFLTKEEKDMTFGEAVLWTITILALVVILVAYIKFV